MCWQVTEAGAFEGHMWAEPSVEHLQQLMRRAASNPAEARAKGRYMPHTAYADLARADSFMSCCAVLCRAVPC